MLDLYIAYQVIGSRMFDACGILAVSLSVCLSLMLWTDCFETYRLLTSDKDCERISILINLLPNCSYLKSFWVQYVYWCVKLPHMVCQAATPVTNIQKYGTYSKENV